jgi:phage recombination protein Bet
MSTALTTLTHKLAARFEMGDGRELIDTLKATAFRGQVSDAQMTALLVVANQYGLNPWTKEVYAFPDKNNGIVPVVGVDGWTRILNANPEFDGMDFEQTEDACTCRIYRKDRSHPTVVTEYLTECRRDTGPWKSHPRRMLRHKAMIQAARLAFGYGGIYDQDEAERIVDMGDAQRVDPAPAPEQPPQSRVAALKAKVKAKAPAPTLAAVSEAIKAANTEMELAKVADLAGQLPEDDRRIAREEWLFRQRQIREPVAEVDTTTGEVLDAKQDAELRQLEGGDTWAEGFDKALAGGAA